MASPLETALTLPPGTYGLATAGTGTQGLNVELKAGERRFVYVSGVMATHTQAIGLATAFAGLHRHAPQRQTGWLLVLVGFLGWVVGDALFSLQSAWGIEVYPSPADGVYLLAYVFMAAGLVVMVRRRGGSGDLAAVLDAAILATGTAVVAGVFVVAPIASDSSLSAMGKVTSAFYPVADILLLAILVRFWATPSVRTTAFKLLICALGLVFVHPGPAEEGEHPVAHQLGHMPLKPCDFARDRILVGAQDLTHLLRVETPRKRCGANKVAEHHREPPSPGSRALERVLGVATTFEADGAGKSRIALSTSLRGPSGSPSSRRSASVSSGNATGVTSASRSACV